MVMLNDSKDIEESTTALAATEYASRITSIAIYVSSLFSRSAPDSKTRRYDRQLRSSFNLIFVICTETKLASDTDCGQHPVRTPLNHLESSSYLEVPHLLRSLRISSSPALATSRSSIHSKSRQKTQETTSSLRARRASANGVLKRRSGYSAS